MTDASKALEIAARLRDACTIHPNYGKTINFSLGHDDLIGAADMIESLVKELAAEAYEAFHNGNQEIGE